MSSAQHNMKVTVSERGPVAPACSRRTGNAVVAAQRLRVRAR
jgi:hypothetical protein